jgi:hypothetical protein
MPGMWFELERIFAQDGITIGECHNFGLFAEVLFG